MEPLDPNDPLTPKQKALIAAEKREEMTRKMQEKLHKDFPTYAPVEKKKKGFAMHSPGGSMPIKGRPGKRPSNCLMVF